MSDPVLIDYAFDRPSAKTIKKYPGVVRYGAAGSPTKLLTPAEVKTLHAAGSLIALVFETTADRAKAGRDAGVADRQEMEAWAKNLGYPATCPIFYAVDFDATWAEVKEYFGGIMAGREYKNSGVYGGYTVVEAFFEAHPGGVSWQTIAWSAGKTSTHASLYQYGQAKGGVYNYDRVLKPLDLWGPKGAVRVPALPKPKPAKGFSKVHAHYLTALTKAVAKRDNPLSAHAVALLDKWDAAEKHGRAVK